MTVYKGLYQGYDPADAIRKKIEEAKPTKLYIVWLEDYDGTPDNIIKMCLTEQEAHDYVARDVSVRYIPEPNGYYSAYVRVDHGVYEYDLVTQTNKCLHRYDDFTFKGKF